MCEGFFFLVTTSSQVELVVGLNVAVVTVTMLCYCYVVSLKPMSKASLIDLSMLHLASHFTSLLFQSLFLS